MAASEYEKLEHASVRHVYNQSDSLSLDSVRLHDRFHQKTRRLLISLQSVSDRVQD